MAWLEQWAFWLAPASHQACVGDARRMHALISRHYSSSTADHSRSQQKRRRWRGSSLWRRGVSRDADSASIFRIFPRLTRSVGLIARGSVRRRDIMRTRRAKLRDLLSWDWQLNCEVCMDKLCPAYVANAIIMPCLMKQCFALVSFLLIFDSCNDELDMIARDA
ncbi:hypothetical protein DFH11DRAFT_988420 [Phellopilus nigrolimitatus]|nr:hypothetical protein DFH11DRAFT_988420 [Phellopilus nigrolimitatus]